MLHRTLEHLIQNAIASGLTRIDVQMLLLHAYGQDPLNRAWLFAHAKDKPTPAQAVLAERYFRRRYSGEPVAYIIGFKEFYGLRLNIDSSVLDPRSDTETLVDWALEHLTGNESAQVLDLGTGSGAIALAIKHQRPQAQVSATDASQDALAIASGNAAKLGLQVKFVQADRNLPNWFASLRDQRFHLILSNPPYIAEGDMHLSALTHEPALALASGTDGLDAIRGIIAHAAYHLEPKGWLLLEHGHDQSEQVSAVLVQHGFADIQTRRDLSETPRCTGGRYL